MGRTARLVQATLFLVVAVLLLGHLLFSGLIPLWGEIHNIVYSCAARAGDRYPPELAALSSGADIISWLPLGTNCIFVESNTGEVLGLERELDWSLTSGFYGTIILLIVVVVLAVMSRYRHHCQRPTLTSASDVARSK